MTLIEVLVVLVVLGVLAALILPGFARTKDKDYARMNCMNNLKQVGLAFRVWAGDNNDKFPMQVSETNGGSIEFISGPNAFRHFQVMSNELSTSKVLICRAEYSSSGITAATNWTDLNNSNISYFVGVDAQQTSPRMILAGDHNITNALAVQNGIFPLVTNQLAGWTAEIHKNRGNILLADGSVQLTYAPKLRELIKNSGVSTNRLQMP